MQTGDIQIINFILLSISIICLLVILIFFLFYTYKKTQAANARKLELLELRNERDYILSKLEIQEDTFNYISREIHDNINLGLTLAKLHLNTINLAEPNTGKKLHDITNLLTEAIEDLRNLSHAFNGSVIQSQGLLIALQFEIGRLEKLGTYTVFYEVTGETSFLDAKKELIVFRIIQESITNILKHANATTITISINYEPHSLTVVIKDNGKGINFETTGHKGNGLPNMHLRAKSIGGTFAITPLPDSGTQSTIHIPF